MSIKIVADSGSDIFTLDGVLYSCVPLKITTAEREFTDDIDANAGQMLEYLKEYKGKSGSSCPSVGEWLEAFGYSEEIICVALTSALSGSYNSACVARERYLEQYPERKVLVIDSSSAGPGMGIIVKKLEDYIKEGKSFEEISGLIKEYKKNAKLTFVIKSLNNLAKNGRVKASAAMLAAVLGICLVCEASEQGTIVPMKKVRGEKAAIRDAYAHIKNCGYRGGRVMVNHCGNEQGALQVKNIIISEFPDAKVIISKTHLLCSFYAEQGGILIGFEK